MHLDVHVNGAAKRHYLTVDLDAASNIKEIIKSKEADLPTPHPRGYIT